MRRALIAAVVLVVALGACGSGTAGKASSSKISTAALVTGAADAATHAKTAKISGEMSVAIGGRDMTLPMDGAIDFENQAAELRVDMAKMVGQAGLTGDLEIRMVDGSMYMNMGSLLGSRAGSVLHGKDWVSVDMSQMGASGGTQNPADMLQSLRGAGDVREIGTEDLDGTPTTHYRAEVDLQKAIEKLPVDKRSLAEKGMKLLGTSFPIDVWIGHDGLPRRIQLEIDVPGGKGSVKERMDFSDYGADVSIQAPPADQVQSMNDFQQAAAGV